MSSIKDIIDYRQTHRIIFHIEPDNAQILLNGRFIGEAYEFSTYESALKLRSRNNEIIIKNKGYHEKVIDLYDYSNNPITIRYQFIKEKSAERRPTGAMIKPKAQQDAYTPKTEKSPPPPALIKDDTANKSPQFVDVILKIKPEESSIYLEGKFWGISPAEGHIENLKLVPGTYQLEVVKPGFKMVKRILKVLPNKKLEIHINLKK